MKRRSFEEALPEGYVSRLTVDCQDKKLGILMNLAALAIMGVFAAVLLVSFAPISGGKAELPIRQMVESMTQAPLASVAVVAGKTPDAVLAALVATYPQANAEQSISDLTGGDMEQSSALLAQVFAAQTSE